MKIIDINKDNIDREHISCALSNTDNRAMTKKEWMKKEFENGLIFKRLDGRGKVFIEYIPIENAYAPVLGQDYMYINCLWVSGSFKGEGYGNSLLEECIKDSKSKGKRGLVALSSIKKKPFLSDGNFYKYKGFKIADTMDPYYELLYLNFDEDDNSKPSFIKNPIENNNDIVVYYSNQCPHNGLYIDLIEKIGSENNIDLKTVKFESKNEARKSPNPFTTYSIYVKGEFITNEILSEKKFITLLEDHSLK